MDKTTQVSANVLGRKAAEYNRLLEAGTAVDRVLERQREDATVLGVALDEFLTLLEPHMEKKRGGGKRAAAKVKREAVGAKHLEVCSFLNEAIMTGSTDVAQLQTALNELGEEAEDWVLMTAVRKDEQSGQILFTINDSGWHDGSNRTNQYADRPQMVGKSGRHTIHPFQVHGS